MFLLFPPLHSLSKPSWEVDVLFCTCWHLGLLNTTPPPLYRTAIWPAKVLDKGVLMGGGETFPHQKWLASTGSKNTSRPSAEYLKGGVHKGGGWCLSPVSVPFLDSFCRRPAHIAFTSCYAIGTSKGHLIDTITQSNEARCGVSHRRHFQRN